MATTSMTVKAVVQDGRLRIDVPTTLPAGQVEVELHVSPNDKPRGTDIAAILKLAGTLEYKGDPMALQRELRDEWPD